MPSSLYNLANRKPDAPALESNPNSDVKLENDSEIVNDTASGPTETVDLNLLEDEFVPLEDVSPTPPDLVSKPTASFAPNVVTPATNAAASTSKKGRKRK